MVRAEYPTTGMRSVHESIREMVEHSGYEYVGSELVAEEGHSVLRVYIDSLGGINVKDCETVSRLLGKMLDEIDPGLPERYFLQVSSPGVERPLLVFSDYERFIEKKIRLKLKEPIDERKTLVGIIESAFDGKISLFEEEAGRVDISFENILKSNLVFETSTPNKPAKKEKKEKKEKNKRRHQ